MKIWADSTLSNVNSSPVIYGQVVYIGSNDYNLYALNIINGGIKWKFSTNGLIKSSPLAYKGTIYIGSYDKYFYAVDSAAGTLKWSANVNGQMQCSPAIEDYSRNQYNSQMSGYTN
jgi:outer membrane protein assembly factor BamB